MKQLLLLLLMAICLGGIAQKNVPRKQKDENAYEIYQSQFRDLMASRGLPEDEIKSMLARFKDYSIDSDEKFADALGKLYPSEQGIAILCFYLNRDTLRRVLFEPGKIREKKIFIIKRQMLLQLGNDINHVLGLYKKSADRLPAKRGFIVKHPPQTPNTTYDSIIRKASMLFLPEALDTAYKHLVILPVLNIGTIPFPVLRPYSDSSMLVDRCSFTIVPGIIDMVGLRFRVLKKISPDWNGDFSTSFDPYEFQSAARMSFIFEHPLFVSNPSYPQHGDFIFPDLPGAKKEIDSALAYATSYTLLEGKNATKEKVTMNLVSGQSDVAYFATHGIADDEKPMEKSFLVLSGNDPYLTAKDIMDLRKSAAIRFPELVILSACQSGLGKPMEAGVAGLARSFLLAGSNHVVMSLWNVDDDATSYLMSRFIFHLQKPGPFMPARPLRLAMLDAREKYKSPALWASFSLFGIDY